MKQFTINKCFRNFNGSVWLQVGIAKMSLCYTSGPGCSVGCASDWYSEGCGFDHPIRQHSFVEIGHEIISMAILSLPLIQVGQFSVTGERMCTKYWLTA